MNAFQSNESPVTWKNTLQHNKLPQLAWTDAGQDSLERHHRSPQINARTNLSHQSCYDQARELLVYILQDVRSWATVANTHITRSNAQITYILMATLGTLNMARRTAAARQFRLVMHEIDILDQGRLMIHCDWQSVICPANRRDIPAVTYGLQNTIILVSSVIFSMSFPSSIL